MTLPLSDERIAFALVVLVASIVSCLIFKKIVVYFYQSQRITTATQMEKAASNLNKWSEKEDDKSLKVKFRVDIKVQEDLTIMTNDHDDSPSLAPSPPRSRSRSRSISRILNRSLVNGETSITEQSPAVELDNKASSQTLEADYRAEVETSWSKKVLRWSDLPDDTSDYSRVNVPSNPSHTFHYSSFATYCDSGEDDVTICDNYSTHSCKSLSESEQGHLSTEFTSQREYELQLRAQIAESLRSISGKSPHPLHFCISTPKCDSMKDKSTDGYTTEGSDVCSDNRRVDYDGFNSVDL